MNIFQLECFLAVADLLSFAKAADRMHITQPSITHLIKSLENELNVKLFHRSTRSVEITEAGEILCGDAQTIVQISEQIKKRFETPYNPDITHFSIGCHTASHLSSLPDMLKKLAQQYPSLHPTLQVIPFKHLFRLLENEMLDVILSFQESRPNGAICTYRELTQIPITAVCSASHPLSGQKACMLKDLETLPLIINSPAKCPPTIAALQNQLTKHHSLKNLYYCDTPEQAFTLVKSGFGITLMPKLLTASDPSLSTLVLLDIPPISFGVYYKTQKDHPVLADFIKIAQNCYA